MGGHQSKTVHIGRWTADRGDVVGQGLCAVVAVAAGATAWRTHGWVRLAAAVLALLCAMAVVWTVAVLGGISLLIRWGERREQQQ
jgi:membrane protein YdbS with pleckstrin-like domain